MLRPSRWDSSTSPITEVPTAQARRLPVRTLTAVHLSKLNDPGNQEDFIAQERHLVYVAATRFLPNLRTHRHVVR